MDSRDSSISESSPLLKDASTTFTLNDPTAASYNLNEQCRLNEQERGELENHGVSDQMKYKTESLTTWEAFAIHHYTIWVSASLWKMMARLGMVALGIALITIAVVPNPENMKIGKFTSVSKFLNVIVGLLLGFFLTSSMNRWYSCVSGFLELLDAIRNLQMQFVALGVPDKDISLCMRYGLTSAWLLYGTLLIDSKTLDKNVNMNEERNKMWRDMVNRKAHIDRSQTATLLNKREADALRKTRDPPGVMWMWVASLIARLAQDGWLPGMATPTYGRIMNLCQNAHGGIRTVKASISVQAPLTYTHMLATLVHINNLLNALTFGIVGGLSIGTSLMRYGYLGFLPGHTSKGASHKEAAQDWQNFAVTFLYCFFGPLLYQALLLISMHLAQPFGSPETAIPMNRMLQQLEVDLVNAQDIANEVPWEKPCFKQPPHTTAAA